MNAKEMLRSKGMLLGLGVALGAAILGGGGYVLYQHMWGGSPLSSLLPSASTKLQGSASTPTATPGQSVSTTSTPTATPTLLAKTGLKAYTSSQYPFGFYLDQQGQYDVKEAGNKIEIYNTTTQQTPVYMEVFQKDPADTLSQAITKAVLGGYAAQDCPITMTSMSKYFPSSYQTAQIHYAASNVPAYGAGIGDITKCPHQYTVDDDAPYFLTDTNHPNLLLFFFNGQVAISGGTDSNGNAVAWSDTFTFLN